MSSLLQLALSSVQVNRPLSSSVAAACMGHAPTKLHCILQAHRLHAHCPCSSHTVICSRVPKQAFAPGCCKRQPSPLSWTCCLQQLVCCLQDRRIVSVACGAEHTLAAVDDGEVTLYCKCCMRNPAQRQSPVHCSPQSHLLCQCTVDKHHLTSDSAITVLIPLSPLVRKCSNRDTICS